MEFTLKGGVNVREQCFEELSEKAAAGDYPGEPGEWAVRPQDRPSKEATKADEEEPIY